VRWLTAGIAVALAAAGVALPAAAEGGDGASLSAGSSSPGRAAAERLIRECANRNRRARGLGELGSSQPLSRAARLQAKNMARLGFFDHTDPQGRGVGERVAIFDRAHRFVYIGENIAAGYPSPAAACTGWMHSPGHKQNILNPTFTHIGGGFASGGPYGRYYVQVFGATSSASSSHLK
jgi:uncharacterized protein YkwD